MSSTVAAADGFSSLVDKPSFLTASLALLGKGKTPVAAPIVNKTEIVATAAAAAVVGLMFDEGLGSDDDGVVDFVAAAVDCH